MGRVYTSRWDEPNPCGHAGSEGELEGCAARLPHAVATTYWLASWNPALAKRAAEARSTARESGPVGVASRSSSGGGGGGGSGGGGGGDGRGGGGGGSVGRALAQQSDHNQGDDSDGSSNGACAFDASRWRLDDASWTAEQLVAHVTRLRRRLRVPFYVYDNDSVPSFSLDRELAAVRACAVHTDHPHFGDYWCVVSAVW